MKVTGQDLLTYAATAAGGAVVTLLVLKAIKAKTGGCGGGGGCGSSGEGGCCKMVNKEIMKDQDKVATVVSSADLGDTTAYCRCWRSKKFPLCDGSHSKHNQETGDNVGPVVIKKAA